MNQPPYTQENLPQCEACKAEFKFGFQHHKFGPIFYPNCLCRELGLVKNIGQSSVECETCERAGVP